ncbi:MAG: ATP-binding protein, partial [Pyramidobacter sp.]|nr:ATP-binding protein [Pyramidobacter sp.]
MRKNEVELMTGESLTVEYKREYIDDIKKTIIAFANTNGGELLIGVDDDGTVLGVDDLDDVMLKVTNSA